MDEPGRLEREELEAALGVRRELGSDYEPALVDSFAERIERAVEKRVDARVEEARARRRREEDRSRKQLALGIVGVNWAYAWQNRRGSHGPR